MILFFSIIIVDEQRCQSTSFFLMRRHARSPPFDDDVVLIRLRGLRRLRGHFSFRTREDIVEDRMSVHHDHYRNHHRCRKTLLLSMGTVRQSLKITAIIPEPFDDSVASAGVVWRWP